MVSVASQILTGENSGLQALQISWHPFSNSHLGVLTSDSVFRYASENVQLQGKKKIPFSLHQYSLKRCILHHKRLLNF